MTKLWLIALLAWASVVLDACGTLHADDAQAFHTNMENIRPFALQ